ncbi:hypothetical protein MHAS_03586 [Mycolicibacterium hassiacum DSM 44199]|jgi:DNA-binding MarR family transcriptional regulator|nr:transcriptional regulator [Mycolicibacterium hassiacum DSM 44199]PZN21857.1 MAG: transcriptional regulator [Mycolicibacterium hassiacum]VCT91863.1 hypothetical protein MHAS_03586 [Mycolicibacterium hassiacum DSM 44199]
MVSVKTKTALISEIDNLISALSEKFDAGAGADAERDFIAERLPARLVPLSRSLPTLSMHLLAAIADAEPVSVVGLAARTNQLKGTVSKHVQRLVEAGLVERGPVPGNRKEVQLRLTADGRLLADAHAQMHVEMTRGLHDFLHRYSAADLQVLARILRDLVAARRDGVRIVP